MHVEISHFKALLLKALHSMQNGMVLELCRDDMALAFSGLHPGNTPNRPIICFGSAGGKENFFRLCPQQRGDLAACSFYRVMRGLPQGIKARRISIMLRQKGEHCLHHLGGHGGGRRIVRINVSFNGIFHVVTAPSCLRPSFSRYLRTRSASVM